MHRSHAIRNIDVMGDEILKKIDRIPEAYREEVPDVELINYSNRTIAFC